MKNKSFCEIKKTILLIVTTKSIYNIFIVPRQAHDTTSHTLSFVLLMIGMHPEVQENILEEDQLVRSTLTGREITYDDLQHYSYLERVIKETLRLYPVGPYIFRVSADEVQFRE